MNSTRRRHFPISQADEAYLDRLATRTEAENTPSHTLFDAWKAAGEEGLATKYDEMYPPMNDPSSTSPKTKP